MQYLLHDLIKLPMAERLSIIERAICSITQKDYDYEQELLEMINGVKKNRSRNVQLTPFQIGNHIKVQISSTRKPNQSVDLID